MRTAALVALTSLILLSSAISSHLLLSLYAALTSRPLSPKWSLVLTSSLTLLGLASALKARSAGWLPLLGLLLLVLVGEAKPHLGVRRLIDVGHPALLAVVLSSLYVALTLMPKALELSRKLKPLAGGDLSLEFACSVLTLCLTAPALAYLLLKASRLLSPYMERLTVSYWYLAAGVAASLVAVSYYVYVRYGPGR